MRSLLKVRLKVDLRLSSHLTLNLFVRRARPSIQDPSLCAHFVQAMVEHRRVVGGHVEQAGLGPSVSSACDRGAAYNPKY